VLLAIDVGNTHTVIGLYSSPDSDNLVDHWRISTNAERTSDECALMVQEFLAFHGRGLRSGIHGVAISSVVPRVSMALRDMTVKYFGFEPVVVGPGIRTGMPILTDNPKEVGADRIVNSIAAFTQFGGPAIVIDFGTATTFDAVSAKGEYLGGAIVPGIEISLEALTSRAAALRRVELVEPRNVIGKNTVESIQSGVIFGYASLVDGLCERMENELGDSVIVATGGLATLISPYCDSIEHIEPWLTLHGLRIIYERNTRA
jgi:type III pantothenate kinase